MVNYIVGYRQRRQFSVYIPVVKSYKVSLFEIDVAYCF